MLKNKNILDIVIIGGGISGLYLLYQTIQKYKSTNQKLNIHLYEKNDYYGGRIFTLFKKIQNHTYKFETGAARLCKDKHKHFQKLIYDFHLEKYLTLGKADIQFIPSSSNYTQNPIYIKIAKKSPYFYIQKVLQKSKRSSQNTLMKYSFSHFIKKYKLLSKEELNYLHDSFGYSGEISFMNAFNAIHMFGTDLNKKYYYYSLSCGLSHLIQKIIFFIQKEAKKGNHNILLKKNHTILDVSKEKKNNLFSCKVQNNKTKKITKLLSKNIVFAIQKFALLKQSILQPYKSYLNSVDAKALCRIYMVFKRGKNSEWMEDVSKTTTNTHNRYLIPLDKEYGSIMISYTDSIYATHLYNYDKKYGRPKLITYILDSWEKTLDRNIPNPIYTKICYWKEGIAMWKPNKNSLLISQKILNPTNNIFIIGENYSLNQAWIEGALQTVHNILPKIKF
jgi:hypothetical protein